MMQAFAFVGGLAAVGLVVAIGTWIRGRDPILTLVLTGVVPYGRLGVPDPIAVATLHASSHQRDASVKSPAST